MIYIVLGFGLIALIDFVPLIRRGNKRAMIAFGVFFVGGLCLALLKHFDVHVPSTLVFLGDLLKSVGIGYRQ